ncbi:extracellular solute-binding protein [Paenibacillus sp. LHD-38]|uniref:extracellular solute-binding protein n=1 Tax=Paenibacillus sp. LHD-38 TaxID=3072143 RepID=UPI00280E8D6A|nr:extracellular solute-binding protein [Paenibacillus sp. LHD-38]MDQ8735640.1 extracellular solute-binding protein [Paenibacillus sp. LHD-38]
MREPIINKAKLLLTALLSVQILSACSQSGSTNNQISDETEHVVVYQDIALSKYNPPIDVTFVRETSDSLDNLISQFPGQTLEDNSWSNLYEQVLGIKIKYDWIAKGDLYRQKLGVALASGNIPDVVRVNAQQLRLLSNAGLIQDLSKVYEKYASQLTKNILSQEGTGPFDTATIDGKLMGIPETNSSIEGAQFIWIRTDWLDQLGMKPPKTIGDVLVISKAFTEKDPDQNGSNDTLGLAVTKHLWDPVMGLSAFMAGYDAFPNIWIKDNSGKLVFGGIQPEVKTALKALQDMYRKGQIDSEFGLKDGVKVEKQVAAGKIGMLYGEQWGSFLAQSSRADNPNSEWQAFPIVSVTGEAPKVPLRFSTSQYLAVRKGYSHPEAIVKLFNLHLEKNWGETAEYETYYSSPFPVWQLSPVTPYPARKNLEAFRQLEEARRTGDTSVLKDEARSIQKNIDNYLAGNVNKESGWGWERTYGPSGAFAILDQYEKNNQLLYENFVGAPTETMIEKQAILDNLQHETFVNIILGRPIDEFDQFVEEWHKLGGEKMTTEVNQWFAGRDSK